MCSQKQTRNALQIMLLTLRIRAYTLKRNDKLSRPAGGHVPGGRRTGLSKSRRIGVCMRTEAYQRRSGDYRRMQSAGLTQSRLQSAGRSTGRTD